MMHASAKRPMLLGLALCLAAAAGCSSADGDGDPSKTPGTGTEKRDTRIIHEPCNGAASDAQKVDVNGDGNADIIHVMKDGREACRILDLNMGWRRGRVHLLRRAGARVAA